jgi:hypothetical protein
MKAEFVNLGKADCDPILPLLVRSYHNASDPVTNSGAVYDIGANLGGA